MKSLVFDTGPLITLALNNLLWTLKPLKEKFGGEFYITESVKKECVDKPLQSKKFRFEAIQMLRLIESQVLDVYRNSRQKQETQRLLALANSLFRVHGNCVKNVQFAEIETIATAISLESEAVVIDEFITRMLVENPDAVRQRMERKLHETVEADAENVREFTRTVHNINVIRSFELVAVAFEQDLFREYYLNIRNPRRTLLEGLLWALKLSGCSVSEDEIAELIKLERL